jgi:excinuclease ABC subunit C
MRPEIADKLSTLPPSPGVYLMKDHGGGVFYVGKAKNLRDRVRSYFTGSDERAFVARLDTLLADLEVVLTHTEKEALILENDLIKRFQPRFNVKLVDDKRFLCLRLDLRQATPRLEVVRQFAKDGARYFGPFDSAHAIRETLKLLNRHFRLRTCSDATLTSRRRPCLQHQIGRCLAPCVYDLSHGEYAENVAAVVAFLEGREHELLGELNRRMQRLSATLEYERAATVRDQIRAVERSLERQRLVTPDFVNRDVVGLYRQGAEVELHVLRTRGGRLVDARRYSLSDVEMPAAEVLADFAARYYTAADAVPEEILFPPEMEWQEPLSQVLSEKSGHAVRALVPQRGDKTRLVEMAQQNARQAFIDKQRERGAAQTAMERLQRTLHLRRLPASIECFDISHLQGRQVVASAVRFEHGVPRRDRYRHYRVKTLDNQDDFQAMYEVLGRRARRGLEEGDLPDLIVIDGGKGQLNAAHAALQDHGIEEADLVALAKARPTAGVPADGAARRARTPERVFVLGRKNPVILRQDSSELFLLTRARDEAHRFAIGFQRRLRRRAATRSQLDSIPGIGPKRRQALLRTFGSVARLRAAALDDVIAIVGRPAAVQVLAALRGEDQPT